MEEYILTDHAVMQMRRRGISEEYVIKVMAFPEQIVDVGEGRCVYQSRLTFGEPACIYLVRVFVDVCREPKEVVTVYRTRKIEKYWR